MKNTLIVLASVSMFAAFTGGTIAADLIINEQSVPFSDEPLAYDWTGPYIGIDVGAAFGLSHVNSTDEDCGWWCGPGILYDPTPTTLDDDHDDFFPYAGIEAGFNYQLDNNFVIGIEGDLQVSNLGHFNDDDDDEPLTEAALVWPSDSFDLSPDINWWGTLRGRAGIAMDRTLIYATGGLAFAQTSMDAPAWALPDGFNTDDTRFGFAIGAGIEHAVTDEISIKAEYLFVDLGEVGDTTPFEGGDFNGDLAFHTVRAGLNFHF